MLAFPHSRSFIVFLGPDGCGKTTIIDQVAAVCSETGQRVEQCTFNFGLLPSLSSLLGRKQKVTMEGAENAGMVSPLSLPRSLILCCWYGLDLILGHIRLWRTPDTLFIFSRFYMDFFYQRAHRKAPSWLLKIFLFFGPKPKHIIVLKRDPQAIFAQKPELSVEEIKLQYELIHRHLSKYSGYAEIDATQGIETTVQNVLATIKE